MIRSGCSLACSAIHCCFVYVLVELRVSSSVSHQWLCTGDAPLPSSGSRWPRFPAFSGTIRALRLPAPAWPSAYWFRQPAPQAPAVFVSATGAPAAAQARRRAGVFIGHAGRLPFQRSCPRARAGSPRFPGNPSHDSAPVHDPGRPVAPRRWRRFRCCPHTLNSEGVIALPISRLPPPLHHLLSTLHDGRCRTPCKTRFRLAGCAFAGRESNPLDRYERVQFIASSSPGLRLAQ